MTGPSARPDPPGRQFERTALAWLRTALATAAVAVLILREADAGIERWVVGAGAALGLAGALTATRLRTMRLHEQSTVTVAAGPSVRVSLVSVLVLQLCGLALAF